MVFVLFGDSTDCGDTIGTYTAISSSSFNIVVKCSIKPASMSEFHNTKFVYDVVEFLLYFIV